MAGLLNAKRASLRHAVYFFALPTKIYEMYVWAEKDLSSLDK